MVANLRESIQPTPSHTTRESSVWVEFPQCYDANELLGATAPLRLESQLLPLRPGQLGRGES